MALFDDHVGGGGSAEVLEATERDALAAMKEVCCLVLRGVIESRDDGAPRLERNGRVWYRVEETARTVMTSLGAVEYRRPRYRRDGVSASIVPVDESLGLVNGSLTRKAAHLGVWLMGHCTAREAEAFFGIGLDPCREHSGPWALRPGQALRQAPQGHLASAPRRDWKRTLNR